ncbi:alpha/beta hydrolase [Candidatus Leptofilum sp.]|uniref:alpha/beta hydrolase n=1 Tax=Candidatus Leptofilum sp. TaxID=3241576 RepID=UPI003B595C31
MKRKIVWIPLVIILLLVIVFLAGPRVVVDTELAPVNLPDDLDSYLAESEAQFSDIVPNAEKTIIWAGEPGQKTEISAVYLHGFSATRQETAPLSDNVVAELGANLFYTRFTGHGRSGEAMAEATVNDWLNDTWEAYQIGQRLGEKVIVIGVSTGGTAATWLAAQPNTDNLLATVLISPNFGPTDPTSEILTWPWAEQIVNLVIGSERSWEPANEGHAQYWTESYPTRAILPMMGLVKLTRRADLAGIQSPVLVIYSPNDTVVSPAKTEEIFAQIGVASKEIAPITDAQDEGSHVLAGDILAPNDTERVQQLILDFVAALP